MVISSWITPKSDKNTGSAIGGTVEKKNIQYYFEGVKSIVAVMKFANERGLGFRGLEEKWGPHQNGNFMGVIQLIANFDPFLHEHLEECKNE